MTDCIIAKFAAERSSEEIISRIGQKISEHMDKSLCGRFLTNSV